MSANYDAILFLPDGRPTYFLMSQWRVREPVQPLQATVGLLETDRTGNADFGRAWHAAFPDRSALPTEPLADKAGRGTQDFWAAFG